MCFLISKYKSKIIKSKSKNSKYVIFQSAILWKHKPSFQVLKAINLNLDKLSSGLLKNQRRHDFDQNNKNTKIIRNKVKRIQRYKV